MNPTEIANYFQIALTIVGAAATIAALVPQFAPAVPVLGAVRKLLDVLAMNVLNAKNAPPPSSPPVP